MCVYIVVIQSLSNVCLFVTSWTVTCQTLLSMGFSRQKYWNGLSFPSPGDLPKPEIEPVFPALTGGFFIPELPEKPAYIYIYMYIYSIYVTLYTLYMLLYIIYIYKVYIIYI